MLPSFVGEEFLIVPLVCPVTAWYRYWMTAFNTEEQNIKLEKAMHRFFFVKLEVDRESIYLSCLLLFVVQLLFFFSIHLKELEISSVCLFTLQMARSGPHRSQESGAPSVSPMGAQGIIFCFWSRERSQKGCSQDSPSCAQVGCRQELYQLCTKLGWFGIAMLLKAIYRTNS